MKHGISLLIIQVKPRNNILMNLRKILENSGKYYYDSTVNN